MHLILATTTHIQTLAILQVLHSSTAEIVGVIARLQTMSNKQVQVGNHNNNHNNHHGHHMCITSFSSISQSQGALHTGLQEHHINLYI